MNKILKISGLTTLPLTLLITGAIDSIRNLPTTALFGTSLVFFFVLSALLFLIPAALISAELSAMSSDKNGIYYWVKSSLGNSSAVFAAWLQWINTMVWFPTILSFIAGTATYFIDPTLAQNKLYLVSVILSLFWFMTWINLKGFQSSAKFANMCTLIGMVIPMIQIIGLAVIWILLGKPIQIHFTATNIIPSFSTTDNWISLTAIMAAFLGIELATVHIKEVHQPHKTFPVALSLSVIIILATMIMGSLAIAFVLPKDQINLVSGIMQAFTNFFSAYHLSWFIPVITAMLLIGSMGNMVSWIISPAKSLLFAAQDGYLPKILAKQNKNGVASNLLILQAVIVTFVCLAFLLMPSVNGSYWLLTAQSTQLYILMYVMMFITAIYATFKNMKFHKNVVVPGNKIGMVLVCCLGLIGCAITLIVGFFPPSGINVGTPLHYVLTFCLGMLFMISPVILLYVYKSKSQLSNQGNVVGHSVFEYS